MTPEEKRKALDEQSRFEAAEEHVFEAMEAFDNEVQCWRVIELKDHAKAIRDREFASHGTVATSAIAEHLAVPYHDFASPAYARSYIKWRGIKAALEYDRTHHPRSAEGRAPQVAHLHPDEAPTGPQSPLASETES